MFGRLGFKPSLVIFVSYIAPLQAVGFVGSKPVREKAVGDPRGCFRR